MANKAGWDLDTLVEVRNGASGAAEQAAQLLADGYDVLSINSEKGSTAYCRKTARAEETPKKGK